MSTSTTILDEFEKLLSDKASLDAKITALAPKVVDAGRADDQPVDVDHILEQIGKGVSVEQITVTEPVVTDDRIKGFKEAYVGEAKKNADRIRKIIAVAATIALTAAKAGM